MFHGSTALDEVISWKSDICAAYLLGTCLRVFFTMASGNHYIAFRILAIIRHKVFECLRREAPVRQKLEGRTRRP